MGSDVPKLVQFGPLGLSTNWPWVNAWLWEVLTIKKYHEFCINERLQLAWDHPKFLALKPINLKGRHDEETNFWSRKNSSLGWNHKN